MAYESPIRLATEIENKIIEDEKEGVYKAVLAYKIDISKDELFKLLYGDRKQYEKGFADGYAKGTADAAAQAEAIPVEWIEKQKAGCVYGSIPWIALEALLDTWREYRDEPEAEP